MTETKFTKGEWEIVQTPEYFTPECSRHEIHSNKCDGWICKVQTNGKLIQENEGIANAKLICAAPDMLAALIAFTENVDHWLKTGIPADEKTSKDIYNKAKNAIKKATI